MTTYRFLHVRTQFRAARIDERDNCSILRWYRKAAPRQANLALFDYRLEESATMAEHNILTSYQYICHDNVSLITWDIVR